MAELNQDQNVEDAKATEEQDASVEDQVQAAPEQDSTVNEAQESESEDTDEAADELGVTVALDPDWADEHDVDSVTVGTADGEYTITAEPLVVTASEAELLSSSPAVEVK